MTGVNALAFRRAFVGHAGPIFSRLGKGMLFLPTYETSGTASILKLFVRQHVQLLALAKCANPLDSSSPILRKMLNLTCRDFFWPILKQPQLNRGQAYKHETKNVMSDYFQTGCIIIFLTCLREQWQFELKL